MYNCILMQAIRKQDAELGTKEVLRQTVSLVAAQRLHSLPFGSWNWVTFKVPSNPFRGFALTHLQCGFGCLFVSCCPSVTLHIPNPPLCSSLLSCFALNRGWLLPPGLSRSFGSLTVTSPLQFSCWPRNTTFRWQTGG